MAPCLPEPMQPPVEDQPTERIERAWTRLEPVVVRAVFLSTAVHVLFLLLAYTASPFTPEAADHRIQHLIQVADWTPPGVSVVLVDMPVPVEPPVVEEPAPIEEPVVAASPVVEEPAPVEPIVREEPAPVVRRERPVETAAIAPDPEPPAPSVPAPPVEDPSPLPIEPVADPTTPSYEAVATSDSGAIAPATSDAPAVAVVDPTATTPGRGTASGSNVEGNPTGTTAVVAPAGPARDGLGEVRRAYQSSIEARVRRAAAWTPAMRRQGLAGTIHLEIRVDADGRIVDVLVHRSSGNPSLDDEAMAQIRSLRRLPQPPSELGEEGRRLLVPLSYGV